ncbi:hypothetical protein MVEN_00457300 [Mycena venus]|uniref:Uncharacterized protein n=1 Tax=Mycena venus TaxID=2733690 RepID=A0A8H7DAQ5_9AGAR|nr:hypothetical protein MVEN_00457300 [Mycena venus]
MITGQRQGKMYKVHTNDPSFDHQHRNRFHITHYHNYIYSAIMVWVSNLASVSLLVSVTNISGGVSSNFTIYPKQNETPSLNLWTRNGPETMTVIWDGGKTISYTVQKADRVLVWDGAYGIESNVITTTV